LVVSVKDTKAPDVNLEVTGYGKLRYDKGSGTYKGSFWIRKQPDTITIKSSTGLTTTAPVIYDDTQWHRWYRGMNPGRND
jgi:hypothetical protein